MRDFNQITANIKSELQELKKISEEQSRKFEALRLRLNISSNEEWNKLSIEEAFEYFYLKNYPSQKVKAFNRLKWMGINYVSDFPKIDVNKLLTNHDGLYVSSAIIIVLMEHYGINSEIDKLKDNKAISKLKEKIDKIREEIRFT